MSYPIVTEIVGVADTVCSSDHWEARTTLAPNGNLGFRTLNARSVEFIAQPGKIRELRSCIRGSLMDYLKKQRGFSGAIVLTSHKEPRLVLVMSLWKTEGDAAGNRWESSGVVLKMLSPLIDVCTRVHTYEAALPNLADASTAAAAPIC
jgi:hypothetical protein